MCMGALISLRFSVLALASGNLYSQHTDLWTYLFSSSFVHLLFLSLFLSLIPRGLFVCTPPPLLPPSSLPYCTNSLHKISHLLTQFTEIHFPPNPKTHTGVHVHSFVGGGCWSLVFQDEFMSVLHQCTTIHGIAGKKFTAHANQTHSEPRLLLSIQGGGTHRDAGAHVVNICMLQAALQAQGWDERERGVWFLTLADRPNNQNEALPTSPPIHLSRSPIFYSCLISSNVRFVFSAILHPYPAEKTCICHAWMLEVCWCFQQAT